MSELALGQIKGLTVNSNIVTVPSGHTLYAPGHVIQVVTFSTPTGFSTTATSWTATNLTATITPKSTSSKIVIQVSSNIYSSAAANNVMTTIFRGATVSGTNLATPTYGAGGIYSASGGVAGLSFVEAIDTPNTTSATTYTFAVLNVPSGSAMTGLNNTTSVMKIMEIAA